MAEEKQSLVKALKEYFGVSGGQLIKEFKDLTDEDKDDFVDMFAQVGIQVERGT